MAFFFFHWDDEIIEHLAQHGVTREEFAEVVQSPDERGTSRSTGRPTATGVTSTSKTLFCVYEMIDADTVLPVRAYEV